MTAILPKKIPFLVVFISLFLTACSPDTSSRYYQKTSNYNFEDTLMNLDIAISEHNYRIIHRSNIGQAIRDRGEADYPLSTVISFCNITYAHEMMQINTNLINDMPCIVTVREELSAVIVGTKLMTINSNNKQQNEFAIKINKNLRSIVEATIE
ncbi:DUF302 domain-containing protein [Pseudomonadota bacterium]|nr:DUF302 domain-containing protein [Pseudomonadota bacterium]